MRAPATGDQLLGLDKEFNFADATASELHIVTLDGNFTVTLVGMDLALDRMHILDGGKVEIFAPDERAEFLEERRAAFNVASHGAGLDKGCPLPVLAIGLVIIECCFNRDGQRRGAGIRAQAQIDPEHITIACPLLQDAAQLLGKTHEHGCRVIAFKAEFPAQIKKQDDVDIGGIVEFESTVLAHAENNQPAVSWPDHADRQPLFFRHCAIPPAGN